jgi:protein-tyrosine phosphatase
MISFSPVDDNLFIGSTPQGDVDITFLKRIQVSAVLSLQSDADLEAYKINWPKMRQAYAQNSISVHRYPIIDFDEQDLADKIAVPIQQLDALLKAEHRVYVHCNAGICRAPSTVLGYLVYYRDMEIDQALEMIRVNRPQVHPYLSAVKAGLSELRGLNG